MNRTFKIKEKIKEFTSPLAKIELIKIILNLFQKLISLLIKLIASNKLPSYRKNLTIVCVVI